MSIWASEKIFTSYQRKNGKLSHIDEWCVLKLLYTGNRRSQNKFFLKKSLFFSVLQCIYPGCFRHSQLTPSVEAIWSSSCCCTHTVKTEYPTLMPFYLAMYWSASTQVGNINLGIPPQRRATQIMGKCKGMGLSRLYGTAKRKYLPCNNYHTNTGYNTKLSFGWSKMELTPRTAVLPSFLLQVSYFCRTSVNGS